LFRWQARQQHLPAAAASVGGSDAPVGSGSCDAAAANTAADDEPAAQPQLQLTLACKIQMGLENCYQAYMISCRIMQWTNLGLMLLNPLSAVVPLTGRRYLRLPAYLQAAQVTLSRLAYQQER